MESLTYRLDMFEGPLDLLLTLIQKNKVNIEDIPISLICDQYLKFIYDAQNMDMTVASEFLVMASELMLIKSKMLLPKVKEDEEDPRKELADALIRYKQAKEASAKLLPLYAFYSERQIKDTDEISIDKTYVAEDQDPEKIFLAIRRIIDLNNAISNAKQNAFTPMIAKPIVSVESKIVKILDKMQTSRFQSLETLTKDAESLPDLIATFMGVLELIKAKRILIIEDEDMPHETYGIETKFEINKDFVLNENENSEIEKY